MKSSEKVRIQIVDPNEGEETEKLLLEAVAAALTIAKQNEREEGIYEDRRLLQSVDRYRKAT